MKKKLINFLTRVSFIFRPFYWISSYHIDKKWDTYLNEMLDNPTFKSTNCNFIIELNDNKIWIGSFPYAFGSLYNTYYTVLPRRATRIRLKNAVDNYFKNKV